MSDERPSDEYVDCVLSGEIGGPISRYLAREVQAWRASGLTPEQAQRLAALVLGGECTACGGTGLVGGDSTAAPKQNRCGCPQGRTSSLAERLSNLWVSSVDADCIIDAIVAELREALA
jgi:hypothetical protein